MGGDGGVIASNRRYMRGVGFKEGCDTSKDTQIEQEEANRRLRTCALSGTTLSPESEPIVACAYGRLYTKEAALASLLARKSGGAQEGEQLGKHVRGLKDLFPVHFSWNKNSAGHSVPICPVTGRELNGLLPCRVVVRSKEGKDTKRGSEVNVLSDRAWEEMGIEAAKTEYGPIERRIRLAPPQGALKEMKKEWEEHMENISKKKKKKKIGHSKKRTHDSEGATNVSKKVVKEN